MVYIVHICIIYTGWPRKHYPSLSQVAEIMLIMTQIGHFATRFLTKSKEMGTIWTSRFEDKSINLIARYFNFYLSRILTTPWPRPF